MNRMYVDEIQHPETGEFHLVAGETRAELEQKIADLLADVVDLDPAVSHR